MTNNRLQHVKAEKIHTFLMASWCASSCYQSRNNGCNSFVYSRAGVFSTILAAFWLPLKTGMRRPRGSRKIDRLYFLRFLPILQRLTTLNAGIPDAEVLFYGRACIGRRVLVPWRYFVLMARGCRSSFPPETSQCSGSDLSRLLQKPAYPSRAVLRLLSVTPLSVVLWQLLQQALCLPLHAHICLRASCLQRTLLLLTVT